ncbi:normal lung function maintenance, low in lung cancer 1 protein domain-containing protein [Phthorimaea operculella]|nr:normal lung function maintenance, low in lung cancer 1 protein domain-containing protein [Phthorimaea operculella]
MGEQGPPPTGAKAPTGAGRGGREPSTDPVKAQGILRSVNRKNREAARLWHQRWGFYTKIREYQEEEALKLGISLDEYRAAVRSVSCKPEEEHYPVEVDPSPKPLPPTSAGMIGRRATCPLERYGRLVMTARDYPIHPSRPPGSVYDPYKQTMMFLGSVEGDPISYKLPPARSEVTDDMWARPQQLTAAQFSKESLDRALESTGQRRYYYFS